MAFELPPLPYAPNALEPHMSANTFSFHHAKHHQAYVTNLNNAIKGTPNESKPLEALIQESANPGGDAAKTAIFNNAAQVWNHTFFWHSMKPGGGGKPTGDVASMIDKAFGSLDAFKDEFKKQGVAQFGSGWVWLVSEKGALKVTRTANADLPMAHGQTALLTCDVWEHAYYLDFQNRRPDFLQTFLDHLVNWEQVAQNLAAAK